MPASTLRAYVDWDRNGNFTGTFDDVTTRVLPSARLEVEYGRDADSPLAAVVAGEGAFTLTNTDRRYTNRNTGSPLFGKVLPARPVKVERTVSGTPYPCGPRLHTDSQPLNPDRDTQTVSVRLVDYLADLRGKTLSTAMFTTVRAGAVIGTILDAIGWAGARDLDTGVSVFPFWWEEGTDALEALDKVLRSEGWPALAYVDGAGTFVFRDRHHRMFDTTASTSQATFRASGVEPVMHKRFTEDAGWTSVVNDATSSVELRRVRDLQVVWESDDAIVVPGGEVVTLVVQLTDPVTEVLVPTQNGDLRFEGEVLQSQEDNPGYIRTVPSFTTVTASLSRTSGQSMILTLTNGGTTGEDETVTKIVLYGRPVTSTTSVQVSASDATSITAYGSRGLPNADLPWCSRYDAQRILDRVVAERKVPLSRLVVTFQIGRTAAGPVSLSAARAAAVLARGLCDRVTVVEPESGISGDFYVDRIRHDAADDLDHVVTMWLDQVPPVVAPALASTFTFDTNVAGRRFDSGAFA